MDIAIRLKLAKKVRQLRKDLGLTQEKLSEVSGIDYKYIQRIEGKRPPNIKLETIEKLAKTLKTTPSKLLDF
jgi:transcriptional regulator with XRE-family HTH domain